MTNRSYGQEKPHLDGRDVGSVGHNGNSFLNQPAHAMNESTQGLQSDLLEKIRTSDIRIRCRITEVRLEKARAKTITIKHRDVGTDFEGWTVEEKLGTKTLEDAMIVGIEILNRG